MKPIINLSYFDHRIGPALFYSYPEAILAEDLSDKIGSLMDQVFSEGSFTYSFEDKSLLNYYFEIKSPWSRGGRESLMLTLVFQRISGAIEQKIIDLFKRFQNKLDAEEEIFTGLYINYIESRGGEEKKIIVKYNSLIKLYIKELYLSMLEYVEILKKKKEVKKSGPKIFISYSTEDSDLFEISHIATEIEKNIINSLAWYSEKDAKVNWVEFMDKGISECDMFMLFCSPNSSQSEYVTDEWQAAYIKFKENKEKIIPIFIEKEYIPVLFKKIIGHKFNIYNKKKTIGELIELISERVRKKDPKETQEIIKKILEFENENQRDITKAELVTQFNIDLSDIDYYDNLLSNPIHYDASDINELKPFVTETRKKFKNPSLYDLIITMEYDLELGKKIGQYLLDRGLIEEFPNYPPREEISLYLCYSTYDDDYYKINKFSADLRSYKEINNIFYWEEEMNDNVLKYFSDNLEQFDVLLLFCSPNALKSDSIRKQWTTADVMGKPIIPIHINPKHIPALLQSRPGFEFDIFNFEENIDNIASLLTEVYLK